MLSDDDWCCTPDLFYQLLLATVDFNQQCCNVSGQTLTPRSKLHPNRIQQYWIKWTVGSGTGTSKRSGVWHRSYRQNFAMSNALFFHLYVGRFCRNFCNATNGQFSSKYDAAVPSNVYSCLWELTKTTGIDCRNVTLPVHTHAIIR